MKIKFEAPPQRGGWVRLLSIKHPAAKKTAVGAGQIRFMRFCCHFQVIV
jgi:hypothetical protein